MAKNSKVRVLISDCQPIFRSGLRHLLSRKPGIAVIGEAEDSREALKIANEQKPTILVLDATIVESNGVSGWQELQDKHKNMKVILLTASEKPEDLGQALTLKPAAIVSKQVAFDVLVSCIEKLQSGETWENAAAAGNGVKRKTILGGGPASYSPLSVREKQVVGLVSQGYRNREIAERMFISEQTVKNHLHNIFDKLGVSDRLELALFAIHGNFQSR